jgi:triosephosphate isomerase
MKQFLFAANWKMYLSAHEEIAFCLKYKDELIKLAQTHKVTIALCPSFVSLQALGEQLDQTPLMLGAQDCSEHSKGAFTGQVSAQSLAEVGCAYTIIGHSERRIFQEGAPSLAKKTARLFEQKICPIICVGETREEYDRKETAAALTRQLSPLLETLTSAQEPFCLAYEPIWAIGTGKTPTPQEIGAVFEHLTKTLGPVGKNCSLLYGGSVTAALAPQLYAVPNLEGFLIGGASIDFQEFKKIVLSRKL